MKKEPAQLNSITLVGIAARTSNAREMNAETAKIGDMVATFFGGGLASKIQHRCTPEVTYAVYTDYESNEHGEYTYFIGEAVTSVEGQDTSMFETITVPEGDYKKFTTDVGEMPNVVVRAWQNIWKMNPEELGGKRSYLADFEVYDQRAIDPKNTEVDIFIGVEPS